MNIFDPKGPASRGRNQQRLILAASVILSMLIMTSATLAQVIVNPLNGHRYEYVKMRSPISWHAAVTMAENSGGYLATITDSIEANIVTQLLSNEGDEAWLGASDELQEGTWVWVTGEPWQYTNWYPGEPNAAHPGEDYLLAQHLLGGRWVDVWDANDGLIIERNEQPVDTLVNVVQWSVSEGGNGHWYALIPFRASWSDARDLASMVQVGGATGHLATITSSEENVFITERVLPSQIITPQTVTPQSWLGGICYYGGGWAWVTGESFVYTNWADSVPIGTDAGMVAAIVGFTLDSAFNTPGTWVRRDPVCEGTVYDCLTAVVEFDTPSQPGLLGLVQWPVSEGGNGHWYGYMPDQLTWEQALVASHQFEREGVVAHLATITNKEENDFILGSIIVGDSLNPLGRIGHQWLGGYDDTGWVWVGGEPMVWYNWGCGEPTPIPNPAIAMVGMPWPNGGNCPLPGEWVTHSREILLGSIVEFDAPGVPSLTDLVQWPVSEGGNGHWYGRLPVPFEWHQAARVATTFRQDDVPGHLATIASQEENNFILTNIVEGGYDSLTRYGGPYWLGAFDDSGYVWITGEPFVYQAWGFGEPQYETFEVAAAMVGTPAMECPMCPQPGEWISRPQSALFGSLVEFDTPPTEPRTLLVPQQYPTIQTAIDFARHGDLVLVGPGIYHESINFLGKNITVRAPDGPIRTIITNERTNNLVTFDHGETHAAVLEGFTLSGGWIAVLCVNSAPTIRRNICVSQNVWNWAAICLSGPLDTIMDPTGDPRYHANLGNAPAVIVNNTIVSSANGGISMFSIPAPTIWNNIVAFNANYGIHQQSLEAQEPPIIGYNDVYGQGPFNGGPFGDYINIPNPGPGAISADPMFSNDYAPIWTLAPGSPCIDAGDPNPRFNDPDGSRNDMGALPFMGGPGGPIPTNEWIVVYCDLLEPILVRPEAPSVLTAYDPSGVLCGRTEIWYYGNYGFMPIYRDDPYTDIDEGCEPGDLIQFKIDGMPVQPSQPVYWTANGDVFEVCGFAGSHCTDIPLHSGWNLISWNVAFESEIRTALDEIIGCVDVVESFEQGALTFDPALDGYNTLTQVDYKHGYWIRMNCDAVLQVCGDQIPPDNLINLEPGWNLVSYWPDVPMSVESGFMAIIDSLQEAMGFDNGAQIWLPNMWGMNTLTELRPTFGYWAKVPGFMPLFYPTVVPFPDSLPWPWPLDSGFIETPPLSETSRSWMSVYGDNITIDGQPLAEGAVITFGTEDNITCGRGVYNNQILQLTPVYGLDESGEVSKRYPKEGDMIAVYVGDERVYPDLHMSSNGARVRLSRLTADSRGLPQSFALEQNYPNPFNPTTKIGFDVAADSHVNLSVFNVLGQKVRTLTDQDFLVGRYELEWNGCDDNGTSVSTGVYFYRLTAGEETLTKKMLLLK